LVFMV